MSEMSVTNGYYMLNVVYYSTNFRGICLKDEFKDPTKN